MEDIIIGGILLEKLSGNLKGKSVAVIDKKTVYVKDFKGNWVLIQGQDHPETFKNEKEFINYLKNLKMNVMVKEATMTGDVDKVDPPLGSKVVFRVPDLKGPYNHPAFDIDDSSVFSKVLNGEKRQGAWWKKYLNDSGIADWVGKNRLLSFYLHFNGTFVKVK